jgi:hypothetical protein
LNAAHQPEFSDQDQAQLRNGKLKMAGERKSVTIHYRRFSPPATLDRTLENLVRTAMETTTASGQLIKNRYLERLNTIGSDNYFINTYHDGHSGTSLVFGDILHFTKGHLQALCKTSNQDVASVPVQQMKAPEQSEYVHSQMFWMVKDDHAFVVQSLSLRTPEFEQYLDWLLKTKTTHLPAIYPVILTAKFDEDAVGGDLGDIQEIIVGGVASAPPSILDEGTEQVTELTQHARIDTGRATGINTAMDVLRALLGGEANVVSLMKAVPKDAELNVQVHIGYQTKKRKVDRVALRQLEIGLRNLPDSQLSVKSKGARVASDGTIRLHHNASVRLIQTQLGESHIVGSLLDPTDVLRAMIEAYTNFEANGKIQKPDMQ